MSILSNPIEYLKGVGPQKAELLQKELNIFTVAQLLRHYPFRYIDRTKFHKVSEIRSVEIPIQLKGTLVKLQEFGDQRKKRLVGTFRDESGTIDFVWFKSVAFLKKSLLVGGEYVAFGKPNNFKGKYSMPHPELELAVEYQAQLSTKLQPVYGTTEKLKSRNLDSRGIQRLVNTALQGLSSTDYKEYFSDALLSSIALVERSTAMRAIHAPKNNEEADAAQKRLKFEEFFMLQMDLLKLKAGRQKAIIGLPLPKLGSYFNDFFNHHLPFELTNAQKRVLKEIRRDMLSGKQMNRLLQGDVGSGKTIVGLMVMLMALDNDYQSCLMAPTEILAQQHFTGLSELVKDLPVNIALLTGSTKVAARRQIHTALISGDLHILIGTHALIEDKVQFKNLGIAIVDEQHRFGVAQRAKLWRKNHTPPHVLVMTATPIPRTLAMTVYGDLDVSIIDELPPGRKPITTIHRYDKDRLRIFGFMKEEISKGRQVYIVYPLIEESETLDLKDLMDGYESISRAFPLPDYKLSIVHGKMKPADKEYEMQRFAKGETQIMVATTVIEVGVNVPNASVMIIENAERFGLSQLHQLRGRVGRGAEQSFCVLMSGFKLSADGRTRLKTMCDTNDGFLISEVDMKLRGPGDIQGTRQSGLTELKLADIIKDGPLLHKAREVAKQIMTTDPELAKPAHTPLRLYLEARQKLKGGWARIS